MDIFKMANEIAKNMSLDDKDNLDNMDMQEMISHVTKNVFGMMNNPNGPMAGMAGMASMMNMPGMPEIINKKTEKIEEIKETESSDDEENCIFAKTPDICFELNVDLEDFYTGKKKKLNVKRKRMIEIDGKQSIIEEKKKLVVLIEKGMRDEQQIRFEGEADQIPGYKPGDIIITLIENEHPIFQRDNDNLIIMKNINLYQSYNYTFDIKHLDSIIYRISSVQNEALHLNNSIRKLSNLGMPSYKSNGMYGDLFIRFNLVLPKTMNDTQLEQLNNIFKNDHLFLENKLEESFNKSLLLENVSDTDLEDLYSEEESDESDDSDDSEESGESDESEDSECSEEESELSDDSESSEEPVVKKMSLHKK